MTGAELARFVLPGLALALVVPDHRFGAYEREADERPSSYAGAPRGDPYDPLTIVFCEWREWRALFADLRRARSLGAIAIACLGAPPASLGERPDDSPSPEAPNA